MTSFQNHPDQRDPRWKQLKKFKEHELEPYWDIFWQDQYINPSILFRRGFEDSGHSDFYNQDCSNPFYAPCETLNIRVTKLVHTGSRNIQSNFNFCCIASDLNRSFDELKALIH